MVSRKCLFFVTSFLGELLASWILLFLGCLGEVDNSGLMTPTILTIGLGFGVAIMIAINSVGGISSGGHLSPIVTLSAMINNLLDWKTALAYVLGQFAGSFLGYASVRAVIPKYMLMSPKTFCLSHPNLDIWRAFTIEFAVSFILVTFVCSIWHPQNKNHHDSAPIKFALFITGIVLVAGKFCGTSMNPARSFAPALYNWNWENHWIYWVAPFCGSVVASLLHKYILGIDFSDFKQRNSSKI